MKYIYKYNHISIYIYIYTVYMRVYVCVSVTHCSSVAISLQRLVPAFGAGESGQSSETLRLHHWRQWHIR